MERKTFLRRLRGLACAWLAVLLILPTSLALPADATTYKANGWDMASLADSGLDEKEKKPLVSLAVSSEGNVYDFGGKTIDITGMIDITLIDDESITLKNADFTCSSAGVYSLFYFGVAANSSSTVKFDAITIDGKPNGSNGITHEGPAITFIIPSNLDGGSIIATIANSTIKNWNSNDNGGAINLRSWPTDGTISLTMTGSTITDCSAGGDGGGGVYVGNGGTFNMEGSTISSCTASYGGGVYNSGTFNMTENSSITGCTASYGGGVYVGNGGTFNMTDSEITGCEASGNGGGVYDSSNSYFTMTNSTISGCEASGDGGGVYVDDSELPEMNGSPFEMEASTISDCKATGVNSNGGGVYLDVGMSGRKGEISLSGKTVIGSNEANGKTNNLYMQFDGLYQPYAVIAASLEADSSIGVTTKKVPTADSPVDVTDPDEENSTDYSGYFFADDSARYHIKNSGPGNVVQLALGPPPDTTPPELTAGAVSRTSDTAATVKFTSGEAGSYYYAVVEKNAAAPTINTDGEGTACSTAEQTITLTLAAGAKDIYIVAKDAAGNVTSPALKIAIPTYVSDITPPAPEPSGSDERRSGGNDYGTVYSTIKGAGGTWTQGGPSGYSFTFDGPFSKFEGVTVDGETVDPGDYDRSEGSTIITLHADYLEALSVGRHTLRAVFSDGYAQTYFFTEASGETNPNTGFGEYFLIFWKALDILKK